MKPPWHKRSITLNVAGPDPADLTQWEREALVESLKIVADHLLFLENWRRDVIAMCFVTLAMIGAEFWMMANISHFWISKVIHLAAIGFLLSMQSSSCRNWRSSWDQFEKTNRGSHGQADER